MLKEKKKKKKSCAYSTIVQIAFLQTTFIITHKESLSDREIAL